MTDLEIDKYKHELADKLAPLITKEGLTDVSDWILKNAGTKNGVGFDNNGVARSVSYILEATGEFQREELEDKSRYYVKKLPAKHLKEKYPIIWELSLLLTGAIIGLAGSYLQTQRQNKEVRQTVENINNRTDSLIDSVKIIQGEIKILKDSIKNGKKD